MASISKGITVYGRLSFPVWSFKDAVERNKKSDYPKTDESTVTPEFHLLLDQVQLDKFKTYVTDVFFPDLLARKAAGETKNALDQAQVDRLLKVVNSDWTEQPPYIPIKPLSEKSAELAP